MKHLPLASFRVPLATLSIAALLLTGCSADTAPTNQQDGAAATATAEPTASASDQKIEKAQRQAASYDYAGALKTLKDESGENVDKAREDIKAAQAKTVTWKDNSQISHVFVHSLIVDTKRAFDHDSKDQGYRDYMVTVSEFKKILEQLYANDYVLINPGYIVRDVKGTMTYQDIKLPKGKKPLVLSQDDPNYYEYMDGDGFAKNLTVKDGKVVATYVDDQGKTHYGDYDMVPIVDAFVKEHPDFSYQGSKGVLAVTGYNGVLGWRTSPTEYAGSKTLKADTQKAKEVADAMKKSGWRFASHSWGHLDLGKISPANLTEDADKWDREVRPILGDTNLLIYPFGSDISDFKPYAGAKFEDLHARGFNTFFNVDASVPAWGQLDTQYARQARINLDGIRFGYALNNGETLLKDFIDVKTVIDPARKK